MDIKIKRIAGFTIDLMIVGMIGFFLRLILFKTGILSENMLFIVLLIIFLTRDLWFSNGSIGKKLMKIKLVAANNSIISKILRNITTLLWPLEGIVLLIYKKRIGDMLFRTDVVDI